MRISSRSPTWGRRFCQECQTQGVIRGHTAVLYFSNEAGGSPWSCRLFLPAFRSVYLAGAPTVFRLYPAIHHSKVSLTEQDSSGHSSSSFSLLLLRWRIVSRGYWSMAVSSWARGGKLLWHRLVLFIRQSEPPSSRIIDVQELIKGCRLAHDAAKKKSG